MRDSFGVTFCSTGGPPVTLPYDTLTTHFGYETRPVMCPITTASSFIYLRQSHFPILLTIEHSHSLIAQGASLLFRHPLFSEYDLVSHCLTTFLVAPHDISISNGAVPQAPILTRTRADRDLAGRRGRSLSASVRMAGAKARCHSRY